MLKRFAGLVAGALLLCSSAAQAIDYRVDFEFSNFEYFLPNQVGAPASSASGYAIFSAASLNSEWDALKDFSLVLGDHTYALSDVGYESVGFGATIGGNYEGLYVLGTDVHDFWLHITPGVYAEVMYGHPSVSGFWTSTSWSQSYTQLTPSPAPEPETYAMLLAGLGLLGAVARRRKA